MDKLSALKILVFVLSPTFVGWLLPWSSLNSRINAALIGLFVGALFAWPTRTEVSDRQRSWLRLADVPSASLLLFLVFGKFALITELGEVPELLLDSADWTSMLDVATRGGA